MAAKRILLGMWIILLLAVTVSSAWILTIKDNRGSYLELEYSSESGNKLTVSSKNVEMIIYVGQDDRYWASSNDKKPPEARFIVDQNSVVPDASIPFRIRFRNTSGQSVSVRVILSNVVCDKNLVAKDCIYVASMGSMEYSKYLGVKKPADQYVLLQNRAEVVSEDEELNLITYDFTLYDSIEIPPMKEGDYVELECYFYFDKEEMDNECSGKHFEVSSFRAIQQ